MRPYQTDIISCITQLVRTKGVGYNNLQVAADNFLYGWFIGSTLEDLLEKVISWHIEFGE